MRRTTALLLAAAAWSVVAAPLAAQQAPTPEAPLEVGIAWSRGAPQGGFADIVDPPQGFSASLSLPVTRRAALGIRGEFSILTLPTQALSVPYETGEGTFTLDVSVRGTLGFTGAGPRLETSIHRVRVAAAVLVGVVRSINDVSARVTQEDLSLSTSASVSDFTVGGKAALDAYVPIYRGARGTSIGFTGGVDWFTGGPVALARRNSFRIADDGSLVVERVVAHPTLLVLRAGIGAAF